jgi:hypothetical protein
MRKNACQSDLTQSRDAKTVYLVARTRKLTRATRNSCVSKMVDDGLLYSSGAASQKEDLQTCSAVTVTVTVFGRVESESFIQQNAGKKRIYAIARRENCSELYYG